ncbi:glutamate--cysteine ligase catalytic subunit-like [Diadema antillarum]|uniref:glutamate--cysteine ligase catalytic subunit-like n=1 Tax=Diadema antillarum TaxID=105358 RepID=UPI003A851670
MGNLSKGEPLSWERTKKYTDYVRKHGVQQFIHGYNRLKNRPPDPLLWGDEIEHTLIRFDHEAASARVLLESDKLLAVLRRRSENESVWGPEYANYVVESTPPKPYGGHIAQLNTVEANMKARRQQLLDSLDAEKGETTVTITAFPRLGCLDSTFPPCQMTEKSITKSIFVPDQTIHSSHPRFRTLTENIRKRRGEKVCINVPIYRDVNTPAPFTENSLIECDDESTRGAKPDHVYMDSMVFGMGCGCLQATIQAATLPEARVLYDQLTAITPIMMALANATPFSRGLLTDVECRWDIISAAVDDRTKAERGLEETGREIPTSRFHAVEYYISPDGEQYNDNEIVVDEDLLQDMLDAGVDLQLAKHVAHLFIRDPLAVYEELIDQDDEIDTDHFENIQSTVWQTMRFKPPPANSDIGWRVEFRPMDVQITDFENAAYVVFVVLLTRVILAYNLNFLIPISKVMENIENAQKRDAVHTQLFHFRKDIFTGKEQAKSNNNKNNTNNTDERFTDHFSLMDVNTIINGGCSQGNAEFPGLVPLVRKFVDTAEEVDADTRDTISLYLELISDRAAGRLKTAATWMRDFVRAHPDYEHDSVISARINYELIRQCDLIGRGEIDAPELLHRTGVSRSYQE